MKRGFIRWSLILLWAGMTEARQVPRVGSEAPDFTLKDSRGNAHPLSSYRGQKRVVLEFFRSGSW